MSGIAAPSTLPRRHEGQARAHPFRRRRLPGLGLSQRPARRHPRRRNAAFTFDITPLLKAGPNEVVVKVLDDMWCGLQPCGKQAPDQSGGCIYTRTTGIWQPVWLEAVGSSFVENISVVPDPDHSRVLVDGQNQRLGQGPDAQGGGLCRRQAGGLGQRGRPVAEHPGAEPQGEEVLGTGRAIPV